MARRSKLEEMFDVLQAILDVHGGRTTHIMYIANLAWNRMDEILTYLEKHGLIVVDWKVDYMRLSRSSVCVTTRGKELLLEYHTLRKLLFPDEEIGAVVLPSSDWVWSYANR